MFMCGHSDTGRPQGGSARLSRVQSPATYVLSLVREWM